MPEIPNHARLIVVLGMARSGTTIFTYVLCRHPQIALFREGPEAWLLENDCLPRRQAGRIGRAAGLFPEATYVVLKRPWQEEHAEWLHQQLPRARFIVLLRDREAIKRSWATTGRWALDDRPQALTDPDACYDAYLKHAMRLPEVVGGERCRTIRYERMVQQPKAVFEELADWLGVERRFDCTPIGNGLHWRCELAEEFPHGDALLDGPRPAESPPAAGEHHPQ
ncbi:MAG TPA: sulfotransferase [Pirellulales bacterium]|nr:sulfotransferase [Pirellulales bacterium]